MSYRIPPVDARDTDLGDIERPDLHRPAVQGALMSAHETFVRLHGISPWADAPLSLRAYKPVMSPKAGHARLKSIARALLFGPAGTIPEWLRERYS